MKHLLTRTTLAILCLCLSSVIAQRPVRRPTGKPAGTPARVPAKVDAASVSYNLGLKCPEDAYDCRVTAFTKAIDGGLRTAAVYKARGLAHGGKGLFYKAILDLRKAISLDKADLATYFELASLYQLLSEPEAAESTYSAALSVDPKNVAALGHRADLYLSYGLADDALSDLSRIVAIDPTNADALRQRITLNRARNAYNDVIADYTSLIATRPDDPDLYLQRAEMFTWIEEYDAALADYSKVIALKPNDPEGYIGRAWRFTYLKRYDDARADFDKAVSLSKRVKALIQRSTFFSSRSQLDDALADAQKAIEMAPGSAKAYYQRGFILWRKDLYDRSIADLTKAIELDSTDVAAYSMRESAFSSAKRYSEALADANKLVEAGFPSGYYSRGNIYSALGDYEGKGKREYELGRAAYFKSYSLKIEREPANYIHYLARASYYSENEKPKAIADLTKALQLRPKCRRCLLSRASFFTSMDRKNDALSDTSKAIEIEPDCGECYQSRANVYESLEKYDLALQDLNKFIELEPSNYIAWAARFSLFRYKLKDVRRALADELKVNELQPDFWPNIATLADLYAEAGDFASAERMYSRVIELKPKDPYRYFARAMFYRDVVKDKRKASEDFRRCAAAPGDTDTNAGDSIFKDCAEWAR